MTTGSVDLPSWMLKECCFLQLKMICECIALGCLVVHGDIKETRLSKLRREWSAEKLLSALANINPQFYPRPYRAEPLFPDDPERSDARMIPVPGGLTRADLAKLVVRCGTEVHRGSAMGLEESSAQMIDVDFSDITAWLAKIAKLLNVHRIRLLDAEQSIFCLMIGPGGTIQVALTNTLTPQSNP